MRDVVKNQYQTRQIEPPRKRRRKRNLSLYYFMIFVLVTIVGVVLSLTVLFKVTKINIIGETQYDTNSIIASSKIKIGDNLFRIDFTKAKDNILKEMIYIDDVKIKRALPCEVDITVEPSVPYANVAYDKGYLLISQSGKILSDLTEPQDGLVIFSGYEPVVTDTGEKLKSKDSSKDKLLTGLCEKLSKLKITAVSQIDITDRYNISMVYQNRINIELGSQSDLEYKINYANELISSKIGKTKQGTLFMRGDNEASFVEKADLEKYEQNYESATVSSAAETTFSSSSTQTSAAAHN